MWGPYGDQQPHKAYEYKPKWERGVDRNPDHQPSHSALYIEDRGTSILWVLQVKGLGVVVIRATSSYKNTEGKLVFERMGVFDKSEIGYAPGL